MLFIFFQEIEKEKAARSELEKTLRVHSSPLSDQTPTTKLNSAFENGVMLCFSLHHLAELSVINSIIFFM